MLRGNINVFIYVFANSAAEQRENPTAVMDALQVFDKKLREPIGQKYMGARSTEDLTAESETTKKKSKNDIATDANGMPMLPPKNKDTDKNADNLSPVSTTLCVLSLFMFSAVISGVKQTLNIRRLKLKPRIDFIRLQTVPLQTS